MRSLSRPLIIYDCPKDKMDNPPSSKVIRKATGLFAPKYKEWMERTHHPVLALMMEELTRSGYFNGNVADIGCGTGTNTVTIAETYFKRVVDSIREGNGGLLRLPFILIALDFSGPMLRQARKEVEENLTRQIRVCQSIPRDVFSIHSEDPSEKQREMRTGILRGEMTTRLILTDEDARRHEAIRIRFAHKHAKALLAVKDGSATSTAILSYVMHWFRGYAEKQMVTTTLANTLFVGALDELRKKAQKVLDTPEESQEQVPMEKTHAKRVLELLEQWKYVEISTDEKEFLLGALEQLKIRRYTASFEEYPQVVRRDLDDSRQIQLLAEWIERAVTVMPLHDVYTFYENAGFAGIECTRMRKIIDEYHDMHGIMFELDMRRKMYEEGMGKTYATLTRRYIVA